MKSSKIALSILTLAIAFASCQSVDFKKTSAGIPYKIYSSSKGDSVHMGSIVKYEVIQKVKDSVIYSSYAQGRPEYFEVKPPTEKLTYSNIRGAAEEVIAKTKAGDSIYMVQATDSLIKTTPDQSLFKKGQQVVTTIHVDQVYKNADEANAAFLKDQSVNYEENKRKGLETFKKDTAVQASLQRDDKIIEDYLKAHNIQAEKNEWGIYIEKIAPGEGPKPKYGQFSNVKYKGMLLSGEVFDQNVMAVQIGVSQVVPGFMEGVSQLSKGAKARIYIPAILAYGKQGFPPKIKPDSILVFEVEILDITDKQPAPQQQPQQPSAQQQSDNDKKQK